MRGGDLVCCCASSSSRNGNAATGVCCLLAAAAAAEMKRVGREFVVKGVMEVLASPLLLDLDLGCEERSEDKKGTVRGMMENVTWKRYE